MDLDFYTQVFKDIADFIMTDIKMLPAVNLLFKKMKEDSHSPFHYFYHLFINDFCKNGFKKQSWNKVSSISQCNITEAGKHAAGIKFHYDSFNKTCIFLLSLQKINFPTQNYALFMYPQIGCLTIF